MQTKRKPYTLSDIQTIIQRKDIDKIQKETGRTRSSIFTLRWNWNNFLKGKPYAGSYKNRFTQLSKGWTSGTPTSNGSGKTETDSFEALDAVFTQFKEQLVETIVRIVTEQSRKAVDETYRNGKAQGAIEVQKQFLEEGKKSNFTDMLKRRLMGAL